MSLQQQIQAEKSRALDERDRINQQLDRLRVKLSETESYLAKVQATEEIIGHLVGDDAPPTNGSAEPKKSGRPKGTHNRTTTPKRPLVLKEGSLGAEVLRVVTSFGEHGASREVIHNALVASGHEVRGLHLGKSLAGHVRNGRLVENNGRWFDPEYVDGPGGGEGSISQPETDDDGYPIAAAAEE